MKTETRETQSYSVPRDWMFGAKSFFMDSYASQVEEIHLAEAASTPGRVSLSYVINGSSALVSNASGLKRIKGRLINAQTMDAGRFVFVDMRFNSPSNIAHAFMVHLPLAILCQEYLQKLGLKRPLLLIFPKSLPEYIEGLYAELGFDLLLTDAEVQGEQIKLEITKWGCLRGELATIYRTGLRAESFIEKVGKLAKKAPKKLFISRKDSRKLKNEEEVEGYLQSRGFTKVYMEDYPVLEQIAMVSHAHEIVAVHGAGEAAIIFRSLFELEESLRLVEIFPAAHLTNVYRVIAHQIGGYWVGVRGKLTKNLLIHGYSGKPGDIRKYSLDDFEVCLDSLVYALRSIKNQARPY